VDIPSRQEIPSGFDTNNLERVAKPLRDVPHAFHSAIQQRAPAAMHTYRLYIVLGDPVKFHPPSRMSGVDNAVHQSIIPQVLKCSLPFSNSLNCLPYSKLLYITFFAYAMDEGVGAFFAMGVWDRVHS